MPLVYCGACSYAPGITARAERADTQTRQALHGALHKMGDDIRATRPDALVVVEDAAGAEFVAPAGFAELERRHYGETQFIFLRAASP